MLTNREIVICVLVSLFQCHPAFDGRRFARDVASVHSRTFVTPKYVKYLISTSLRGMAHPFCAVTRVIARTVAGNWETVALIKNYQLSHQV